MITAALQSQIIDSQRKEEEGQRNQSVLGKPRVGTQQSPKISFHAEHSEGHGFCKEVWEIMVNLFINVRAIAIPTEVWAVLIRKEKWTLARQPAAYLIASLAIYFHVS